MKLSSPAFSNGQTIPSKYSHSAEDLNPPLRFEEIPEKTKSLALIMEDPDAPNGTFNHWLLYNLDPHTKEIREGSVPVFATQGRNDYGEIGYNGPQPPSGEHRYIFHLYALDSALNVPRGAKRNELEKELQDHVLDEAELMGRYAAQ